MIDKYLRGYYLGIGLFLQLLSVESYASFECMGFVWKSEFPGVICEDNKIKINTENNNSYIVNQLLLRVPVRISIFIEDPMFMHWAGIQIGSNVRLRVNNENQRFELLIKKKGWEVVKFIDSYYIFKRSDTELKITIYLDQDNVVAWLDGHKVIEFSENRILKEQVMVSLLSGWKSKITWKNMSSEAVKKIARVTKNKTAEQAICTEKNIVLNNENHLYLKNESVEVSFRGQFSEPVLCRVYDINGEIESETQSEVIGKSDNYNQYKCLVKPSKYGIYKIEAFVKTNNKGIFLEDLAVIAVLPGMSRFNRKESYFGGHIDGISPEWHINSAVKIGLSWIRAHDGIQVGWWNRVQPESQNQWVWPYDKMLKKIESNKINVLGGLLWSPKWMHKENKGKEYPPHDIKFYRKYVGRVVDRYRSIIRHWEIWNEPYFKYYWKGTAEEYVKLVATAKDVIKQIDPNLKIVGGVLSPFEFRWSKEAFDAGLLENIDVLSIHFSEVDYSDAILKRFIDEVRRRGFDGEIWNTEARVYSQEYAVRDTVGEKSRIFHRNASIEIVRLLLENIAYGVDKIFYYHQINPDRRNIPQKCISYDDRKITTGMWGRNNNPKSMLATYTSLVYMLRDTKFLEKLTYSGASFYLFSKNDYAVAAQLNNFDYKKCQPISEKLSGSCNAEHYDLQANKVEYSGNVVAPILDGDPWYLVCHGEDAGMRLKNIISQLDCR